MCNSKDVESRYLGISLMNECVEHLSRIKLNAKIEHVDKSIDLYKWSEFIEIGINAYDYKFGDDLYDLISRGYYISPSGFKITLIEDDQSN